MRTCLSPLFLVAALASSAFCQTEDFSPTMSTFIKMNTNQVCYGTTGADCPSLKSYEDGSNSRHTYMKFDIPVECGRRALTAELRMFRTYVAGSGTGIIVTRVDQNWSYDPNSPFFLDWNNPPATTGAPFPRTVPYVNNTWHTIDFTPIVNEALAAGESTLSIVIAPDYPAPNRFVGRFVGMTDPNRPNEKPYLSVTWDTGGQCATYGTSCLGGIGARGSAQLGGTLEILGWGPAGIGNLYVGLSDSNWSGLPLPFDLGLLGFPGCFVQASLEFSVYNGPIGNSAASPNALPIPVPTIPFLAGQTLYFQYFVPDPSATPGLSEGLAVTFGA